MVLLDELNFEKIFPFYVRINKEMRIISSGVSIQKVIGNVEGRKFGDVFKFIRPSMSIRYDFQSLKEHQDIVVILESIDFPLKTRFRGQFVFVGDRDEILYLNSPWIMDLKDLNFHNLLISDFAIHDTITDNLQLLQSKEIVNEDLKKITDELILQRNDLIDKNETIIELARLPDQNPQPILRLDFDGQILYSNDPAVDLITHKKLLDLPFWGTIYMRFEANGYENYEKEFSLSGQIFHATFVPIKEKRYFNVYLRDITKTLEFQHELMSTTSRLHTLIRSMHSAVLAENKNREIILVNQMFCDLFEIPMEPDLMKGMDCSQAAENSKHLFEDEEGFVKRIVEILHEKERVDGDILKMKNGKILERDYLPIYEEGDYIGHIWKYQDITSLIQSKESLRKVEDKYRKIIENLNVGLMEVDLQENIVKVYPAFCQMTGYSEAELIGSNARELLAVEEANEVLDQQNDYRKSGRSSVYETKIRTKNNEIKWVIISGAPIVNEYEEIVGSIGIHVDITDRKKLEDDLISANAKVLSSVRSKELFLANMSHEIRTPLNVIVGMIDLIDEKELNDDSKKHILTMRKSADSLMVLINDLLDFSKIEAGQLTLEQTNVNLYEIVEHIDYSFSEKAKNKGIQLLTKIDSKIETSLISDSSKLTQVLVNLISNAIKFTEKGYVKLNLDLVNESSQEQTILFSVKDTGIGIDSENIESIFQIFTQEDSSISRKFGGTGLGLSISREIIKRFGSDIKVNSQKNKGSEFSFQVVLKKGKVQSEPKMNNSVDASDLKDVKILIAEDNPLNQTLIQSIFKQYGLSYDLAENGEIVIEMLLKNEYDIILMDIQMPVMDGVTATEHIRKVLKSDIPIIALSANVSSADVSLYRSIGMNDHLAKPYRKEDLVLLIKEVLNKTNTNIGNKEIPSIEFDNRLNSEEFYSLDGIREISGGDDTFVLSIIETFRTNTPEYIKKMNLGLAKGDLDVLKRYAHQMKPSFDILGITQGSKLIRMLEEELVNSTINMDRIHLYFDQLKEILDLVIKDLYSKY